MFLPVERASCFDVTSPIGGLTERILNGRISTKIKIKRQKLKDGGG